MGIIQSVTAVCYPEVQDEDNSAFNESSYSEEEPINQEIIHETNFQNHTNTEKTYPTTTDDQKFDNLTNNTISLNQQAIKPNNVVQNTNSNAHKNTIIEQKESNSTNTEQSEISEEWDDWDDTPKINNQNQPKLANSLSDESDENGWEQNDEDLEIDIDIDDSQGINYQNDHFEEISEEEFDEDSVEKKLLEKKQNSKAD